MALLDAACDKFSRLDGVAGRRKGASMIELVWELQSGCEAEFEHE